MRHRFSLYSDQPEVLAAVAKASQDVDAHVDAQRGAQSDELGRSDVHGVEDVPATQVRPVI